MRCVLAMFALCVGPLALTSTAPAGAGAPQEFLGEDPGDEFGQSVVSVGDVSGDGITDFAVSAPLHDEGGLVDNGKVYIFSGRSLHLLGDPLIGQHSFDQFGRSI